MRISDWSSDVCSSNLIVHPRFACKHPSIFSLWMPEQCPAIVRVHLQYQQIGLERPDELHLPMRAMRTGHHARYPVPALLGRVERFAEHKVVIDPAIGTQLVLVATGHLAALRPVRDEIG